MIYTSTDEAQTRSIGRQLSTMIQGGSIVTLSGDLGTGKTTFAKGFAEGLGVKDTITSPTFSIMNVYDAHHHTGITTLVHIDTYRLEREEGLMAIGVEEYAGEVHTVLLIEWPEKIPSFLRAYTLISVHLSQKNNTERQIIVGGIS